MSRCLMIAVAWLAICACADARTLITDDTGLNCSTNQETPIYSSPDVKSKPVLNAAEETPVHVIGGKQFAPLVDYPQTDSEWARTWLHVRLAGRKFGWTPASVVTCGG